MTEKSVKTKGGRGHGLFLGAILLLALVVRMEGIHWDERLHPDEVKIARWILESDRKCDLGQAYPGGYFTISRWVRAAGRIAWNVRQHWRHWCGSEDVLKPDRPLPILFGRLLNVWLGVLTCYFVYMLVARLARSRWAGYCGAFLMAFSRYHVEHCHYAESDIAMICALAAALWLWVRFADDSTISGFLLATLVSGFAMGTKYYLLLLLPVVLIYAVQIRREGRRWWIEIPLWWVAGLLIFAVGFIVATPEALNFSDFAENLARNADRVCRETQGIIGEAYPDPAALRAIKVAPLRRFVLSLGWPWGALIIMGLAVLFTQPIRKHWPVTFLFPLSFLSYCFFVAPWLRAQECMLLLPHVCLLVSLALVYVWRIQRWQAALWARPVAVLLVAATMISTARDGVAAASIFGWPDSRVVASEWLDRHGVHRFSLAQERYVQPTSDGFQACLEVRNFERASTEEIQNAGCDYVLRNVDFAGRGVLDPRTGEPYERCRARRERFMQITDPVRVWEPLSTPDVQVRFCGSEIWLRALRTAHSGDIQLSVVLPRPLVVDQSARTTYFNSGRGLGSEEGLTIERYPKTFAFGAPLAPDDGVYLVLHTEERSADIRVKGFGTRRRVQLDAYDVEVVSLCRPWWRPRLGKYEKVKVWVDTDDSLMRIPCFLRVAFSADEASAVSRRLGLGARAVSGDRSSVTEAFVSAVENRDWAKAEQLLPRAQDDLELLEKGLELNPQDLRIRGLNGASLQDFAHVVLNVELAVQVKRVSGERRNVPLGACEGTLELPVRLASGDYRIDLEARLVRQDAKYVPVSGPFAIFDESGQQLGAWDWASFTNEHTAPISLTVSARSERAPRLTLVSDQQATLECRNIQLTWSLHDALAAVQEELSRAISLYESRTEDNLSASLRSVRFEPFLDLVGMQFDSEKRTLRCQFQAARDETPELQLELALRRRGGWRVRHRQAIAPRRALSAGELVVIDVVVPAAFGEICEPENMALAVSSAVRYHAGRLSVGGDSRVVLAELLDLVPPLPQ